MGDPVVHTKSILQEFNKKYLNKAFYRIKFINVLIFHYNRHRWCKDQPISFRSYIKWVNLNLYFTCRPCLFQVVEGTSTIFGKQFLFRPELER